MTIDNEPASGGADDAALYAAAIGAQEPVQATPEPAQEQAPATPGPEEASKGHSVPVREVIEERRKRQALEDTLREFIELQKAAMPKPEAKPKREIWDDPEGFVQEHFSQAIDPYRHVIQYNNRIVAEGRFTEQVVNEAANEFDRLRESGALHPAEIAKVMNSPNPFVAAVKWHEQHKILNEVGPDPKAYRERLADQLMKDPEFRKKMMAELQAEATGASAQGSARVSLPSLSKVGAAGIQAQADSRSDQEIFRTIVSKPRK